MIAALLLPYFAATVARQTEPALADRPLLIRDPESDRLLAVCPQATRAGARPGLGLDAARQRCPAGQFVSVEPARYEQALSDLLEALQPLVPRLEPVQGWQTGLIYADFGLTSGPAQLGLAQAVLETVQARLVLRPALGLAGGKFPAAAAATTIGPNRSLLITPGQERSFLAPLPLRQLPLSTDTARRLTLLGLTTVGQLAELPDRAVAAQFGSEGRRLHRLARGLDDRPLEPWSPPPVARLSHLLDTPLTDRLRLTALMAKLLPRLVEPLEAAGQVGRRLELNLQLEDGDVWREQIDLNQPSRDPERLARLVALRLESARLSSGVVAVELTLSGLTPETSRQLTLFEEPLAQAGWLPELVSRYGPARFFRTEPVEPAAYLPEARFRLRELVP